MFWTALIKKGVYESPEYLKKIKKLEKDLQLEIEPFKTLFQLQNALTFSILSSILTSISQFTIGLVPNWMPQAIACWMAIFSFAFVLWSLWLLYRNIAEWFEIMKNEYESNKKKKMDQVE